MTEYLVQWKIDIDATDPVEAAKEARKIQLDTGSIATVFEVTDKKAGKTLEVDLSENRHVQVVSKSQVDEDSLPEISETVTARVWTDDKVFDIEFNAVEWLKQATNSGISDLYMCGFGRDYPADKVAHFMADRNIEIASMFQYLEILKGTKIGFEVEIDAEQMLQWLKVNKPKLWEQYNIFKKGEEGHKDSIKEV
jgi:hypothetical protein